MNLKDRLDLLGTHSAEFHKYINDIIFKWTKYQDAAMTIDAKFKEVYRYWCDNQDDTSKIGANFLLQTMAIMNTRFYRKLNYDFNGLAEELDIPDYSPKHLEALVNSNGLVPNRFKRLKTRVRRGLLDAGHLQKKDERYSVLVDYLEKLYTILSKE